MNVVPVQPGGLAEARAGVNEEHGKLPVVLRTMANFSKQPLFLVDLEKADAAAALFLAAKFGQAVNVAHLACLAEQLAQSSHLTVDGRIAVATLAERSDQAVRNAQDGVDYLEIPPLVGIPYVENRADLRRRARRRLVAASVVSLWIGAIFLMVVTPL